MGAKPTCRDLAESGPAALGRAEGKSRPLPSLVFKDAKELLRAYQRVPAGISGSACGSLETIQEESNRGGAFSSRQVQTSKCSRV